jgi:predicted amidohydrolase YtcJ
MSQDRPVASVLAAHGGTLVYVGDDISRASSLLSPNYETIDLQGLTVIPGLIDSHAHTLHEGLRLGQLDLKGLNFDETLKAVAKAVSNLPPGAWLHGRAWDHNLFPNQKWPDKQALDAVSPLNPVILDRIDKHSLWVNSRALELADPSVYGPDPEGGEIVRSADGSPSGVLIGRAMFLVLAKAPALDGQDLGTTLLLAANEFLSFGLTTVVDAATGEAELNAIERLIAKGELKIRYRAYVHPQRWTRWGDLTRVDGLYDDRLAIDGLKLFSDGSLGSQSAWLLDDYADRPGHRGAKSLDDQTLEKSLIYARDHGLQVAIHVIGDAAVAQAVSVMAKVLGPGWTDRRWRLEHFQVVAPEDRDRALAMGLIPSIQSVGLMTDIAMAESRLGSKRLKRAYAWRDILDRGGYIINGSDCPVESPNPFEGIYAAVTRRDLQGWPIEGFLPEQRLTRWEALASYTVWGAKAAFKSGRLGQLIPGALADFVVIDRDIMDCSVREIAKIKALKTIVAGETVYEAS